MFRSLSGIKILANQTKKDLKKMPLVTTVQDNTILKRT